MIVRDFLQWVRTAPASERAEATSALARAYLYSDLSADDLAAAEGAMLMLLDDPSPLVRRALADALAASPERAAGHRDRARRRSAADRGAGLCAVAAIRRCRSGRCGRDRRRRRAGRDRQPRRAAALGRRGDRRSRHGGILPAAVGKSRAPISRRFRIDRIVERFGHLAAIREALLGARRRAAATRQTLVIKLSETLAGFVAGRAWLDVDHAQRIAREACEKATVTHCRGDAGERTSPADPPSVRQRAAYRRPHPARAVVRQHRAVRGGAGRADRHAGRARFRPGPRPRQRRACGRCSRKRNCRRRPIRRSRKRSRRCARAFCYEPGGAARLKRRMIERVLTRCEDADLGELAPLLTLLRRFATEAAREEARLFCDELVAERFRRGRAHSASRR